MAKFNDSLPKKRILGNKTVIIIGAVILVFLSIALGKEMLRRYEVNKEISDLEGEIAQLEAKNLDLDNLIDYFNTNSFSEKEARQKLGLQKEGETMVVLPQNDQTTLADSAVNQAAPTENFTNPQRWWNYFFKT